MLETMKKCQFCDREDFVSDQALRVHMRKKHLLNLDGTPYKRKNPTKHRTMHCDVCGAGPFRTKAAIGSHMQKRHNVPGSSWEAKRHIKNGTHWSLNGKHKKKFKKPKRQESLAPIEVVEAQPVPESQPVPHVNYCPACGLHMALFHHALGVVANANRRES